MTIKERLTELIELLPEDEARELEEFLLARRDQREWHLGALASFAAHFDDNEVEYTLADARPRPE